jgi:tRNA A37 threonylcarbamoyladenosine biosynthesis protein TsaE
VPVAHVDLFRVGDLGQEDPDLLSDYVGPDRITFVEWPARGEDELAGLGRGVVRVRLQHAGGDRRVVEIG